jgi:hypothetical protein
LGFSGYIIALGDFEKIWYTIFMAGGRFFSGSRSGDAKGGAASRALKEQLSKGVRGAVKLDYQKMVKQKLDEARYASKENKQSFGMVGTPGTVKRSAKAEKAMKMLADQHAAKEAKKNRKAVVVEARRLRNGKVDDKGRVFDMAGNQVAKINLKNGDMTNMYGMSIGKYKQKSMMTINTLIDVIEKNSPYLINQRKMLLLQQQQQQQQAALTAQGNSSVYGSSSAGMWGEETRDIWGNIVSFFGIR